MAGLKELLRSNKRLSNENQVGRDQKLTLKNTAVHKTIISQCKQKYNDCSFLCPLILIIYDNNWIFIGAIPLLILEPRSQIWRIAYLAKTVWIRDQEYRAYVTWDRITVFGKMEVRIGLESCQIQSEVFVVHIVDDIMTRHYGCVWIFGKYEE